MKWELLAGVTADLLLGDPRWLPHPVVGIGNFAAWLERVARASPLPLRLAGALVWIVVVGVTSGFVLWTCSVLPAPWPAIYWIYSLLALRSLDQHALAVIEALRDGDLVKGRAAVAMIVGRDTDQLDERGITRAVIETVAENMNDGVIAPLFWLAIGGPAAMAAYKAINTMDSLFGYRNERYREFGWCAARMDDVASWIPARLTALLIWIVAAVSPGLSWRRSVSCTLRDAQRQPSPNSGYPEAAAAGALGVQLGGVNHYQGVEATKATLGDDIVALTWAIYGPMRGILYGGTLLMVGVVCWW